MSMSNLLLTNYGLTFEINVGSSAEDYASLADGFDNVSEELNEAVQQYFFLDGGGYAENWVTGMAPVYTLTGVRKVGDSAQDWIFAGDRKYGLMAQRNTTLKITRTKTAGKTETITAPVTLCNLTDIGGGTTDGSAVSVELHINGKPTVTASA